MISQRHEAAVSPGPYLLKQNYNTIIVLTKLNFILL